MYGHELFKYLLYTAIYGIHIWLQGFPEHWNTCHQLQEDTWEHSQSHVHDEVVMHEVQCPFLSSPRPQQGKISGHVYWHEWEQPLKQVITYVCKISLLHKYIVQRWTSFVLSSQTLIFINMLRCYLNQLQLNVDLTAVTQLEFCN